MIHKLAQIFRNISILILNFQGQHLQKKLVKRLGYTPKKIVDGCTVDISQAEKDKLAKINNDLRGLLKQLKNDPKLVSVYLKQHDVEIYKVKYAKNFLSKIGEEEGFITKRSGYRAFVINLLTNKKISFKSDELIITEEDELDIYNLIYYMHKWLALKEGMDGFDEKTQILLQKFNAIKDQEKLINTLSLPKIEKLRQAIARDVQAIDFVSQYSKEFSGAQNALEKIKKHGAANI